MIFETTARNGYEHYRTPVFEPRPLLPRKRGTCRICGRDLNRVGNCYEHG